GPLRERARRVLAREVLAPDAGPEDDSATVPGRDEMLGAMLDAVCRPGRGGWVETADWFWLVVHVPDLRAAALRLAEAPHPHAHVPAVRLLCDTRDDDPAVRQALVAFLELGTGRAREVRQQAADWLARHGSARAVLPLLLQRKPSAEP